MPSTWRPVVEDAATLQLFLDFYATTKPPLSSMALECMVCSQEASNAGRASKQPMT